jgi:hypothetical protein
MTHFRSPDVMRFLARKAPGKFKGELVTRFKDRAEGVRVKHWCNGNSIKMYDKAGSIVRIETTIANPLDFKVLRPLNDRPHSKLAWRPMRKGVADLHRRAEVSQRASDAYLDGLSAVEDSTPAAQLFDQVSRHTTYRHRRVRALRIGHPEDIELLEVISRGEFATAGFRNRDLRRHLHPRPPHRQHGRGPSALGQGRSSDSPATRARPHPQDLEEPPLSPDCQGPSAHRPPLRARQANIKQLLAQAA